MSLASATNAGHPSADTPLNITSKQYVEGHWTITQSPGSIFGPVTVPFRRPCQTGVLEWKKRAESLILLQRASFTNSFEASDRSVASVLSDRFCNGQKESGKGWQILSCSQYLQQMQKFRTHNGSSNEEQWFHQERMQWQHCPKKSTSLIKETASSRDHCNSPAGNDGCIVVVRRAQEATAITS